MRGVSGRTEYLSYRFFKKFQKIMATLLNYREQIGVNLAQKYGLVSEITWKTGPFHIILSLIWKIQWMALVRSLPYQAEKVCVIAR